MACLAATAFRPCPCLRRVGLARPAESPFGQGGGGDPSIYDLAGHRHGDPRDLLASNRRRFRLPKSSTVGANLGLTRGASNPGKWTQSAMSPAGEIGLRELTCSWSPASSFTEPNGGVRTKGLGTTAGQTQRHEEGKGRRGAKTSGHSILHLG